LRQIDRLLDEAEAAMTERDWPLVVARCEDVLRLDSPRDTPLPGAMHAVAQFSAAISITTHGFGRCRSCCHAVAAGL
jgi:hypothetical protein